MDTIPPFASNRKKSDDFSLNIEWILIWNIADIVLASSILKTPWPSTLKNHQIQPIRWEQIQNSMILFGSDLSIYRTRLFLSEPLCYKGTCKLVALKNFSHASLILGNSSTYTKDQQMRKDNISSFSAILIYQSFGWSLPKASKQTLVLRCL